MADVKPFRAERYHELRAGPLEQLVAPPYDVISPEERREYLALSPYNVVHLTLPNDEPLAAPDREPDLRSGGDRLWRIDDTPSFAGVELLIADGHHRYETALAYAQEGGSPYLMVVLVPTRQEGLTIFPTHRVAAHVNGTRGTPIDEPGDERPGVVLYRDGRYELLDGDGLDVEIVEQIAPEGVTYT